MTTAVQEYPYQEDREDVFATENGRKALAWSSFVASRLGTFTMIQFHNSLSNYAYCGNTWLVLNLLDFMIDFRVIRELTGRDVAGQDRCFKFIGT